MNRSEIAFACENKQIPADRMKIVQLFKLKVLFKGKPYHTNYSVHPSSAD